MTGVAKWLRYNISHLLKSTKVHLNPTAWTTNPKPTVDLDSAVESTSHSGAGTHQPFDCPCIQPALIFLHCRNCLLACFPLRLWNGHFRWHQSAWKYVWLFTLKQCNGAERFAFLKSTMCSHVFEFCGRLWTNLWTVLWNIVYTLWGDLWLHQPVKLDFHRGNVAYKQVTESEKNVFVFIV